MTTTVRILQAEHGALVTLLRAATAHLDACRATATRPDFEMLRGMLFYVSEFPEKHHHRKESELLFPKLRARTPMSRMLLDRLDEDHARGEFKIRELEHALTAFEMLGEPRREAFEQAMKRYVDFYLEHMTLEEREIFPLALRVLTPQDWDELDLAMERDRDPLTGVEPELEYMALFKRIAHVVSPRKPGAAVDSQESGG